MQTSSGDKEVSWSCSHKSRQLQPFQGQPRRLRALSELPGCSRKSIGTTVESFEHNYASKGKEHQKPKAHSACAFLEGKGTHP
jgi:hypothetical protein